MRTLFLSYVILATVSARAQSLVRQAPSKTAARSNPMQSEGQAQRAGAKLYARECAACHGPNGTGLAKAPPLNRPEIYHAAPGALFWVLRNGSLHTGMPSFAHLPEQQRWQIVTYLQSLRFEIPKPGNPEFRDASAAPGNF